jgi:hypothetical protein
MVRVLIGILTTAALVQGADFGFSVILRAGLNGTGDWELGIGSNLSSPAATANVVPYWNNTGARDFQIGYVAGTNTAFVRVGNDMASFHPAGGGTLAAGGAWTLPASSFYVSATPVSAPTSVGVGNLQLATGMTVLQGFSTTTLATTSGVRTLSSPVVMAGGSSSDWVLTGQITFTGLRAQTPGGASRSQLQFNLTANASDVPEPYSFLLCGVGLLLLGCYRAGKGVRR